MSENPKAVLLVGPSARMRRHVGSLVREAWPDVKVEYHDSSLGRQGLKFTPGRYDGVLIAHDLEINSETGLSWLRELRKSGDLPPTILLTDSDESVVVETAVLYGARACLQISELSTGLLRSNLTGGLVIGDATTTITRPTIASLGESLNNEAKQTGASQENGSRASESGSFRPVWHSDGTIVEVPGYRVKSLIAHGGMSAVYLAIRHGDDQPFALKVLHLGDEHDSELIHRFMLEYASVARLRHPNVIAIEERGFSADFAYIAMEHCPEGNLKSRIQVGLSPRRILDYAKQMTSGLGVAHKAGLIHRDVKPSNMLFRDDGTLVVSDFGVAKDVSESHQSITMPNAVVGTVYYVSPEQVNAKGVDARSDLYGIGAVIYQMLTGNPPFVRQERTDILNAHVHDPVPKLTGRNVQFQKLIDGLLAKDPDDRFQTADEVLEGLNWIEASLT